MKKNFKLERIILWACIEDYAGLWEILWEINSIELKKDNQDIKEEITYIISDFLDRGILNGYLCTEPYGDLKKINLKNTTSLLSAKSSWEVPENGEDAVRFSASSFGEEYYKKISKKG